MAVEARALTPAGRYNDAEPDASTVPEELPAVSEAPQEEPPLPPPRGARQYGDVAAIYDALMTVVPHAAWLSRIEEILRERGKIARRSALDVACGTGLVSELLVQRGYGPVVGVDLSHAMVAVARTKACAHGLAPPTLRYECQNAADLDLPGERFDLAVSLFDSLNYITDPEMLRRAFGRVHAHLAPGGLFAFDLNALYALAHGFFTQTGTDGLVHHVWKAYWDQATRLCRVEMNFWVKEEGAEGGGRFFTETHVQRAYTIPEITAWLGAAGFADIAVFGNYTRRAPGPKSDRLLFVAEKRTA